MARWCPASRAQLATCAALSNSPPPPAAQSAYSLGATSPGFSPRRCGHPLRPMEAERRFTRAGQPPVGGRAPREGGAGPGSAPKEANRHCDEHDQRRDGQGDPTELFNESAFCGGHGWGGSLESRNCMRHLPVTRERLQIFSRTPLEQLGGEAAAVRPPVSLHLWLTLLLHL